ncbi:MAG: bifunctional 23S rRNA (guanine(2069)-N(7))-methyltransferase RlmK/23S rRNA (guanine(2445)-N(2))-methyltransferase RlmL [Spirochaetota bacterium]
MVSKTVTNLKPGLLSLFVTSPKSVANLLKGEITKLGALSPKEVLAGVSCTGSLETAYRLCLWSRLASRVLLQLETFNARNTKELYEAIRAIQWGEHLSPDSSFSVDCSLSNALINNSHYAALVVKDAIADYFKELYERRPSINTDTPDVHINLYVHKERGYVSIDLSGWSLHKRGYRVKGGEAPLKENSAAAMLVKARWPEIAAAGGGFVDPMCGTGTLLIEAALMAADIAPGLLRPYFGFLGWLKHDAALWHRLIAEAQSRKEAGIGTLPPIIGYDSNRDAVQAALRNIEKAGLNAHIHVERRDIDEAEPPSEKKCTTGLIALNPPYGERMGQQSVLNSLYHRLGGILKEKFNGWSASVLTANKELSKSIGLKASRVNTLYNGSIKCCLSHFILDEKNKYKTSLDTKSTAPSAPQCLSEELDDYTPDKNIEMFINRITKNRKYLKKWADKEGVSCYRIYDADLPEYNVAIDLYENSFVQVQEYAPPENIEREKAERRVSDILYVLPHILNIEKENIFLKRRKRQKGGRYEKLNSCNKFYEIREYGLKFLVNFSDYLDTGIFLDHRLTRKMIGRLAQGKHFLNLFSYTGTATVYASQYGALSTCSVDSSNTYLNWAKKNLELNGLLDDRHTFFNFDCIRWLKMNKQRSFDLIFLDPPTFSNSKDRKHFFDLKRDYPQLLRLAVHLLSPSGILLFSNNYRKFKMERQEFKHLSLNDITPETIPPDFARNPHIHNCWIIRKKE